jgi:Zinc knuckle
MSDKQRTGDKVPGSGYPSGKSSGKWPTGKAIVGAQEELGSFVYKFNTRDQADMYLRTTQKIAQFVGVQYGREMKMLVKRGFEPAFTEPSEEDPITGQKWKGTAMERYKSELAEYQRSMRVYKKNKGMVFSIILGQCTEVVKSKLDLDAEFDELENTDDVVGFLKKLRTMTFSSEGIQHPYWSLQEVMRRLTGINQGPDEAVTNYHQRFLATTAVVEAQWGSYMPPTLAGITDDDKAASREQMLAMTFLAGADKRRFGSMLEELNNAYLAKNDKYPKSVESTLTLLSHYQDRRSDGKRGEGGSMALETSFAQRQVTKLGKIRCFNCNEYGHMKRDCPRLQASNAQTDEVGSVAGSQKSQQGKGSPWSGS